MWKLIARRGTKTVSTSAFMPLILIFIGIPLIRIIFIILFSNTKIGFVSGVFMINIENVDEVYRKVKEITNV